MTLPSIPPRWRPLAGLALVLLLIGFATRLALRLEVGSGLPFSPGSDLRVFAVGLGYDLVTLLYVATPLVLLLGVLPQRATATRAGRAAVSGLMFVLIAIAVFVAVAEWTFWQEFQSRFNFIAVDYLVYTQEVLGNIQQSYRVGPILAGIAVATLLLWRATRGARRMAGDTSTPASRGLVVLAWLGAAAIASFGVTGDLKDTGGNAYGDELAGNGIYQFFAAYRHASLDYDRFYRTIPEVDAEARVRTTLATPDATFLHATGIERWIHRTRPRRRLNVVLISIESFSAEYSGTYGRHEASLTPRLDALTPHTLLFSNLYATGTRTVRGLEALSLSVPPTPGESIVRRPGNEHLASLASIFNAQGYASEFLYGGYGAFDDMNRFFGANGYAVHDRTDIPDNAIHHENVWGVADEDLYTMALGRFDATHAAGRPFFAHLMTTSNHRPYTFPAGRGPWKQHDRDSAVRYTDWAVADFIARARRHPWFADTVFVITADHCAQSAGKAVLPAFRYRIPMWIYSPAHIAPGRYDGLMSQIDVAPTVLGLLGMDYASRFYGVDVFVQRPERAFIGTYELLGLVRDGRLVQLAPHRRVDTLRPAMQADAPQPRVAADPRLTLDAISFYESAAYAFTHRRMGALPQTPPHAR